MNIVKATIADAKALTRLTIRSKSHWDYSAEQIEKWIPDLTISEEYMRQNAVFKLCDGEVLIGYYSYCETDEHQVKLDNLFIDPNYMSCGHGVALTNDFIERTKQEGFKKVTLDADPNAASFYLKFGFKEVGQLETSIKDRFLPSMEFTFQNAE